MSDPLHIDETHALALLEMWSRDEAWPNWRLAIVTIRVRIG